MIMAFGLSGLSLPLTGFAQEPLLSQAALDSFIQEALANNRDLRAARAELEAATSRVPQASALPDPIAGFAVMGRMLETPLGPQEDVYELEQMIPFPGKLMEKRKIAMAEVDAAKARLRVMEREVIYKLSETYYDLYAVESALQVVEETKAVLKKSESIANARYSSQKGDQRDLVKVQVEVSQILETIFMLRQQRDSLAAMLDALLNRKTSSSLDQILKPRAPFLSLSLDELLQKGRAARPELLEAMATRSKEQHVHTLAKYEYAPDIFIGFQYTRIGGGMTSEADDGRDAWMIPLKFTLPVWQNRIVPMIREAKRNLLASEARLEWEEHLTQYEIKNAYYRFMSAKQIVDLHENALIPQAELVFRSDQAGYEAGKIDVLNLIDSERLYLNAKMAYYQVLAEVMKNFAALERAVGVDLQRGEP
jgi:outer membrane protein TolC